MTELALMFLLAGQPGETPTAEFSLDEARMRLAQVEEALSSFTELTGRLREDGLASVPEDISFTAWEEQYIGFPNFVRCIRGTMESQALEILLLRIRVTELSGGDAGELELLRARAREQEAVLAEISSSAPAD
jgi:hypothetical protein